MPFLLLLARMGALNRWTSHRAYGTFERLACIAAILLLHTGLSPRRLVVVLTSRFVVVLALTVVAVSKGQNFIPDFVPLSQLLNSGLLLTP